MPQPYWRHAMSRSPRGGAAPGTAPRASYAMVAGLVVAICLAGCGTTRWSDTTRTATEQLILTNAVDRAVSEMNVRPLAGKKVFLDAQYISDTVEKNYVTTTLQQHLLAHGCVLQEKREEADLVVVVRGFVATNRHDVLIGIPATQIPAFAAVPGAPAAIPEIPFAKRTQQMGVAKLALFAFDRRTSAPIWQSGAFPITATAKDTWILGSGPFQSGSIYDKTTFAGGQLPFAGGQRDEHPDLPGIPVTAEVMYEQPALAEAPSVAEQAANAPNPSTPAPTAPPDAPGATPPGGAPQAAAPHAEASQVQQAAGEAAAPVEPLPLVPQGRIVRLPPLEQLRADARAKRASPADSPTAVGSVPELLPQSPSKPVGSGSLMERLHPTRWFGGEAESEAGPNP
jgi:hypothetical protein